MAPGRPDPALRLPGTVLFLDGVRRIDARIWVHGTRPQPSPGIAASFAAGLVSCDGAARIADVVVERGLFTAAAEATGITTRRASYPARIASSGISTSFPWPCSSASPTPRCSSPSPSGPSTRRETTC